MRVIVQLVCVVILLNESIEWQQLVTNSINQVFSEMQTYRTQNSGTGVVYTGNYQVICTGGNCCGGNVECRKSRNNNGEHLRQGEDIAVIFGGGSVNTNPSEYTFTNQLSFYNQQQQQWSHFQGDYANGPVGRVGHSSVVMTIGTNMYLYIYGGMNEGGVLKDFWRFELGYQNIEQSGGGVNQWTRLADGLGARVFHCMFTYQQKVYIYGGQDSNGGMTNSMWEYDVSNNQWTWKPYEGLMKVWRVMQTWDGTLYTQNNIQPNDRRQGDQVSYSVNGGGIDCVQPSSSNNIPTCRAYMTTTQSSSTLYLYGGYSTTPLDDLWILHLPTFRFTQLFLNNTPGQLTPYWPSPFFGAQMYLYAQDNIIFFYGGIGYDTVTNSYQVSNQLWEYRIAYNNWFQIANDHFYSGMLSKGVVGQQLKGYSQGYWLYSGVTTTVGGGVMHTGWTLGGLVIQVLTNNIFKVYIGTQDTQGVDQWRQVTRDNSCNPQYMNRGICFWGRLECEQMYVGRQCEQFQCANSFCYYDPHSLAPAQCVSCSKHGSCVNGVCVCDAMFKYAQNGCEYADCQNSCSQSTQVPDAGHCVDHFPLSQCDCNQAQKRGGDTCQTIFCLNDCTNNGQCQNGVCVNCQPNYTGQDCSIYVIDFLLQ